MFKFSFLFQAVCAYNVDYGLPDDVKANILVLLTYFRTFWMEIATPARFCVSVAVHRTNNFVEAWHMKVNTIAVTAHLSKWLFIVSLSGFSISRDTVL